MLKSRFLAASLLAATALSIATPAAAQRVNRIVAFGDSYADTGNLFRITGTNPATTQIYTTGRFSGGTNYIDTLSTLLNAPQTNFAIGGATTTTVNVAAPAPLGFVTEYQSFLAGGGTLFPATTPRFGPNDLLAVSIGGNDARAYQQGGGTLAGAPAAATAAAASATTGLNALFGVGARNISFLAGNTATLPEVATNPAAQGVRNAFSTTFNTAIQTTLAGYANQGAIVNYLDLSLVGNRITANPAAYGLTSAGACAPVPACVGNSTLTNQYLFYVDQLHLTSAGFAIVGKYIATQMEAPLVLQASSDVAIDTARQFGRTLTTRLDAGSPRDGELLSGVRLFAVGDGFQRKVGASATNEQFNVSSYGGTIGLEAGFSGGTIGIAGNYSRPRARFGNGAASVRSHSYQLGVFGGFGLAGGFAQGYLGYGKDKHRLTRVGVIDSMTANPGGNHWLAGAKAGYLMPMGGLRLGPVVALDYAKAKVNGYTEAGDAALTLNVGQQRFSSLRGDAGLELRGDFGTEGAHFRPFASIVAERDFKHDTRVAVYSQTASPGIVDRFAYAEASRKTYARASAGLSATILKSVSVDAGVSGTFGKKQGNETSGQVGLNFGF